jgi:formate-dependent phosphoribosylglycinamide formyltransferase (GAR transformylase)
MDGSVDYGLLGDPGVVTAGSDLSLEDALALAKTRYRWMPCCVVEDWIIFDVVVTGVELAKVHAAGCLPMILFAHNVRHDDNRRFEPGSWVRSTIATKLDEGFLFVTRNTVYVLKGSGHRKSASLKAIYAIH